MGWMDRRVYASALLAALLVGGLGRPALAQGNDRILTTSSHPYWEVGALDPELSTECARGVFNQQQP